MSQLYMQGKEAKAMTAPRVQQGKEVEAVTAVRVQPVMLIQELKGVLFSHFEQYKEEQKDNP